MDEQDLDKGSLHDGLTKLQTEQEPATTTSAACDNDEKSDHNKLKEPKPSSVEENNHAANNPKQHDDAEHDALPIASASAVVEARDRENHQKLKVSDENHNDKGELTHPSKSSEEVQYSQAQDDTKQSEVPKAVSEDTAITAPMCNLKHDGHEHDQAFPETEAAGQFEIANQAAEKTVLSKKQKDKLAQKMKKSFKLFGVEFAPVMLPIERRLQTLSVLVSLTIVTICPFVLIALMVVLMFTPLFFLPVLYGTWMFLDRKTPHRGGRRFEFMRRLAKWRYFRDYFPISMTKTADLDPSRNYLIGYHPHGVLAFGAMINFGSEATNFSEVFPGITPYILTLNTQFNWPLVRAYLLSFGICAVSRESIKYILSNGKGHAAVIVVGGAEEALEARPGSFTVVLRKRKGFIRQAIQYGADLVPSYSFGENDLFKQLENTPGSKVRAFQEWFKRTMSFSPPIIYGRGVFNYSFGLMPYRRPVDTVIGKPIRVERDENPSEELIEHYHRLYTDSLYELFEEHKARHGIAKELHLKVV